MAPDAPGDLAGLGALEGDAHAARALDVGEPAHEPDDVELLALAEETEEAAASPWDPEAAAAHLDAAELDGCFELDTPSRDVDRRIRDLEADRRALARLEQLELEPEAEEEPAPISEDQPTIASEAPAPISERTRNRNRSRRHREVRAKSIGARTMTKRDLLVGRAAVPEAVHRRLPLTRGACEGGARPCPFVSCHHHLFLDVADNGSIKLNFPDLVDDEGAIDFAAMPETCALDVAGQGGATLERTGLVMNVTRERIRQVEVKVFAKLRARAPVLRDFASEGPSRRVQIPLEDDELEHDQVDEDEDDGAASAA